MNMELLAGHTSQAGVHHLLIQGDHLCLHPHCGTLLQKRIQEGGGVPFEEIFKAMAGCDVIVPATPIYAFFCTAPMKALLTGGQLRSPHSSPARMDIRIA